MPRKTKKRGQGEGSISKRTRGNRIYYEARITVGYTETGSPKQKSKYFKTRKEAQDWLVEATYQKKHGTFVEPSKITLGEWLERWLTVYVKPTVKPGSYANYVDVIQKHIIPSLGDTPLQTLRTNTIQDFYNQKRENGRLDGKGGLSPRMIHLMHQVISRALKQAVRENLISTNPAEHTTLPSLKYKEMTTLKPEEIKEYLEAVKSDRLYVAFLLELNTGLRRGELLALSWDCIDFEKKKLTIKRTLARVRLPDKGTSELKFSEPKTKSGKRDIPLHQNIIKELQAHKARQNKEKLLHGPKYTDNDLVFCTPQGTPIEPRNFHRKHTEILKKAGLPHIRVHDLRHTVATLLVNNGIDPENIRALLGHSKTSTTLDLYCHSTSEGKEKAIETLSQIINLAQA